MKEGLARIIVSGIIGGSVIGLLVGAYVVVLTEDYVVQRDDFVRAIQFEQSQARYQIVVINAFVVVCGTLGPFIAAASFGRWIRHAVYGLVAGVGAVVAVTLVVAAIANQQPFNNAKGAQSTCIDFARNFVVPLALVAGPLAGILLGKRWTGQLRDRENEFTNAP